MSWSYSGNPKASNKDAVRFLVGDTNEESPLVQDEEILWALSENRNLYSAASEVALSIAAYFATQATSVKIGKSISEESTSRAKDYRTLAKDLQSKAARKQSLEVFCGSAVEEKLSTGIHDFIAPVTEEGN